MKQFISGVVVGAILFSGVAYAASTTINVDFKNIKYYFDGEQKEAPADNQGFIYNNTTYVPLRFLSESLGKEVTWEGATESIYVGKMPENRPVNLGELKATNSQLDNVKRITSVFVTNQNEEYSQGYKFGTKDEKGNYVKGSMDNTYLLDGEYSKFEALLAPESIWSQSKAGQAGIIHIYGDDKLLFKTDVSSNVEKPVPVYVDLQNVKKLRIECQGFEIGLLNAKLYK